MPQTAEEVEAVVSPSSASTTSTRAILSRGSSAGLAADGRPVQRRLRSDRPAGAEIASGTDGGAGPVRLTASDFEQAIADYLPSRDSKMLEYMELLAVFEASNRRMLPQKYQTMSGEELQSRLELLRLECANRR